VKVIPTTSGTGTSGGVLEADALAEGAEGAGVAEVAGGLAARLRAGDAGGLPGAGAAG
jgi:hypothetical protein